MSKIVDVLSQYKLQGFRYAIWKDRGKALQALQGGQDIDLIVSDNQAFIEIASHNGFVSINNVKSKDDQVLHLMLVDSQNILYHIHLYKSLVTGSSWVKEFECLDKRNLLENTVKWQGLDVLEECAYKEIHDFRMKVKNRTVLGRYLIYNRQKSKYERLEGESIVKGCSTSIVLTWARRYTPFMVFIKTTKSLIVRIIVRVRKKKDYVLRANGILVVIVGTDGSGKSTVSSELVRHFHFLRVKRVSFGRITPVGKKSVQLKKGWTAPIKKLGVAFLRLCMSLFTQFLMRKGYLVISDRWYNSNPGMDGCKLDNHSFLGKIEECIYSYVRIPDLVIELSPDLDTVLERNRRRIKLGKETDKQIVQRFEDFMKSNYRGKEKVVIDTSKMPLTDTIAEIKIAIAKYCNVDG